MSDYPDPDEEYELMYSDDLDLLREIEDDSGILIFLNTVYFITLLSCEHIKVHYLLLTYCQDLSKDYLYCKS